MGLNNYEIYHKTLRLIKDSRHFIKAMLLEAAHGVLFVFVRVRMQRVSNSVEAIIQRLKHLKERLLSLLRHLVPEFHHFKSPFFSSLRCFLALLFTFITVKGSGCA